MILVVEDNRINQQMAQLILTKAGYAVTIAVNGLQALQCFGDARPDLILMDLQMPVMDGYEAVQKIRQQERESSLPRCPIIALTAHSGPQERRRCIHGGMDDYIEKPVNSDVLLRKVRRLIRRA
jgi:CheY-like chemotaxis protein